MCWMEVLTHSYREGTYISCHAQLNWCSTDSNSSMRGNASKTQSTHTHQSGIFHGSRPCSTDCTKCMTATNLTAAPPECTLYVIWNNYLSGQPQSCA